MGKVPLELSKHDQAKGDSTKKREVEAMCFQGVLLVAKSLHKLPGTGRERNSQAVLLL